MLYYLYIAWLELQRLKYSPTERILIRIIILILKIDVISYSVPIISIPTYR